MAAVSFSGGAALAAKLREIAERAGKSGTLQVGFLENATYPDGTSVAMVAAIQNFGAPAAGIPPRPFFSNMVAEKRAGWPAALGRLAVRHDYDMDATLRDMGEGIAGQLQQSIVDTNSPALAQATVDRKGFAKPLIDTNHMRDSVAYRVEESK